MADRHAVYKAGVKALALQAGLSDTFMAKPHQEEFGSSCHLHCSLRRGDAPVFPDAPGSRTPSAVANGFMGGLMEHLSATSLFYAPFVNSYKRHTPDSVGGGIVAWGYDNRTVTFRIV